MTGLRAIAAPMKTTFAFIASLALLVFAPAGAIVGGGGPSAEGIGRSVVTIVGSRGNFCTGALIAPKLVLTARIEYSPARSTRSSNMVVIGSPDCRT